MAEIIWKATVLLAAAALAQAALGRASAALRHFLWTGCFAALLLLPAAIQAIPKWRPQPIAIVTQVESATVLTVHGSAPAPEKHVSWPILLWVLGCAAAAARFLIGAARTAWMVRHASDAPAAGEMAAELCWTLGIGRPVRVLESASAPMPLTWGVERPVVLLPKGTAEWPEGRLQAVLLHKLIHVRRWDLLGQAVAQAACCLYWFHPLAWFGLRQQRQERERACDDAVLARGVAPHEYASHLVDLVRGMAARRNVWADAPAMAEASGLERRVRDLLARNRNRRPLSRRAALAAAGAMAAVLVPLAAFTALAQTPMSGLSGTVKDPSGAVVPSCHASARNQDGANEETTVCDAVGHYSLPSIPAGQYTLEVDAPGFKRWSINRVTLATGSPAEIDVNLALGQISQVVTVKGQGPQPGAVPLRLYPRPAQAAGAGERMRVGGMVQMAMLIRQPRPEYPADLQAAGVQGVVKIRAIIGKDGTVLHAQVVNTVDSRLAQLALDAVRQWVYQPTLLNGEPVEVMTTIDIDYNLQ